MVPASSHAAGRSARLGDHRCLSVRAGDEAQRQRLAAQDYLTTLIELDPKGRSAEIVGSMTGFVPVQEGNSALIAQMADPAVRIVSLTVTEGGYYIDPVTKAFDPEHPDMKHDTANPDSPRTAFGAMISALKKRRDSRHRALYRPKLRQPAGQWCDPPPDAGVACASVGRDARGLDRRQLQLPQLDGGLHRSRHGSKRTGARAQLRHRRCRAGDTRELSPMGYRR